NLKANANSKNPKTTLTVFNQPPDFGREFNQPGNAANKPNGNAKAIEKPNIPIIGANPPLVAERTIILPTKGPVQENETIASAKAIKNIPVYPPLPALLSILFAHDCGSMISKAPKKDTANITRIKKKSKLKVTLVENSFMALAPKIATTPVPKIT